MQVFKADIENVWLVVYSEKQQSKTPSTTVNVDDLNSRGYMKVEPCLA